MTTPSQTQILTHDGAQKATWFELFFDLVFVVAFVRSATSDCFRELSPG